MQSVRLARGGALILALLLLAGCAAVPAARSWTPVEDAKPAPIVLTPAALSGARVIATKTPRPTATPRPTIVVEMTPWRSANIVAAESYLEHGAPLWLRVQWADRASMVYSLAGFGIEGLNKSGVFTVSLVLTLAGETTDPAGFYICRPKFSWDETETWETHDPECYGARVPFTAAGPGVYVVDVTAGTKASMWRTNNGYQFR